MKINPGILHTVQWLNAHGFVTTDSGDGETHDYECDQPIPYVHMIVPPAQLIAETDRLAAMLREIGVEFGQQDETGNAPAIESSYNPADSLGGVITLWNVKIPATIPLTPAA